MFETAPLPTYELEVESLSQAISLEYSDALQALANLKAFLNTNEHLNFELLTGGAYNAPLLVFQPFGNYRIPIAVLKWEESNAEEKLRAFDEMAKNGFTHFPKIFRGQFGEYLVKLGKKSYSCTEYLKPDANQTLSLEQMLALTSVFHQYAKNASLIKTPSIKTLDWFKNHCSYLFNLNPLVADLDSALFYSEEWLDCLKYAHFFASPTFKQMYDSLPEVLIHGDISPSNILISHGKPYLIDFETARIDIRLRDFAVLFGKHFLKNYLQLLQENTLSAYLQEHYGNLEPNEIACFSQIILLERCNVIAWSLEELQQSLSSQNAEGTKFFRENIAQALLAIHEIGKYLKE